MVTTPSSLVRHVVERLLAMLSELRVSMSGVIENMVRSDTDTQTAELASRYGTTVLGSIPFVEGIEDLLAAASRGKTLPDTLANTVRSVSARIASAGTSANGPSSG